MFVDIDEYKGAIAIENLLMPYKKGRLDADKHTRLPKEPITPEICYLVLQSTNYARNIKDMLLCIAELPEVEQAKFKDIVLSAFDNRCQPEPVVEVGRNLAKTSHYEDTFELMLLSHQGDMLKSEPNALKNYVSSENVYQAILKNYNGRLENLTDYDKLLCLIHNDEFLSDYSSSCNHFKYPKIVEIPFANEISLRFADMSNTQKIVTHENAIVDLCDAVGLHENLEIPNAKEIRVSTTDIDLLQTWKCQDNALTLHLRGNKILYEKDFSLMGKLEFFFCDFEKTAKILTRDGVKMQIVNSTPCGIDFSKCSELTLEKCDLSLYDELKFRKNATVFLTEVKHCPKNLDFSECDEVVLQNMDLSDWAALNLKKGAKLKCWGDVKLPENTDFSQCSEVLRELEQPNGLDCSLYDDLYLSTISDDCWFNFDQVDNPNFKDGAKVSLTNVQAFLPDTDFSKCSEVEFVNCNAYKLKTISLQNCDRFVLEETSNLHNTKIEGIENCSSIRIRECDLSTQKGWRFKDGARVELSESKKLPEDLDFSHCAAVDLSRCDLSSLKNLRFAQDAVVILNGAKHIPENLDVSKCKEFSADWGDFRTFTELRFAKGAKVNLRCAKKLPQTVDFSQCSEVCLNFVENFPEELDFSHCLEVSFWGANLSRVKKLVFGECTDVSFQDAKGLPVQLDFSSCREVNLKRAKLGKVQQITFRSREQMKRSNLELPANWKGKLIIADEQTSDGATGMSVLAMAKTKDGR